MNSFCPAALKGHFHKDTPYNQIALDLTFKKRMVVPLCFLQAWVQELPTGLECRALDTVQGCRGQVRVPS